VEKESPDHPPPQLDQPAAGRPVESAATPPAPVHETTWQRLKKYLEAVLPKPLAAIFTYSLGTVAIFAGAVFLTILLLPLLSIASLKVAVKFLPDPMDTWLRSNFVSAIHTGYDIDKVRKEIGEQASRDVLEKLSRNNKNLDYIQYLEFNLSKTDQAKEIPTRLRVGQRAEIFVRRSEVTFVHNPQDTTCSLAGPNGSDPVLSVSLERVLVVSLPPMTSPGKLGQVHLSKDWWAEYERKVRRDTSGSSDGELSIFFGKTPELNKAMSACTVLKVEATVAVFKEDSGAGV
jgi:hypothetical protein